MRILLSRLWVLFSVPAGLLLLLAPFNLAPYEFVNGDFIFLQAAFTNDSDSPVVEIKDSNLQAFPHIFKIIRQRHDHLEIYRQAMTAKPRPAPAGTDVRAIQRATVKILQRSWQQTATEINPGEWQSFVRSNFSVPSPEVKFSYQGIFFTAELRPATGNRLADDKRLGCLRYPAGAILFLSGLFCWRLLYFSKKGIRIAGNRVIFLWDIITIVVLCPFMHGFIDLLLTKFFATRPLWDNYFHGLGLSMTAAIIPLLTLYISMVSGQSLKINGTGIELSGIFKKTKLDWSDLNEARLEDVFTLKQCADLTLPKHVTKVLHLIGKENDLLILEPPSFATKNKIFSALKNYAPSSYWQGKFETLLKQWS